MILEASELTYVFGRAPALRFPDLAFAEPFVACVVGQNGVGKTTFSRLLAGLLAPTSGTIRVLGEPADARSARGTVAYVPDSPVLYYDLSVREQLSYVAEIDATPAERVDALLERFDFGTYADHPPGALSRGWRQRAALALGLLRPCPILVIDEPFVGLDRSAREILVALLSERLEANVSSLVVTHEPSELADVATATIELG